MNSEKDRIGEVYIERINKVFRFIDDNLDSELNLEQVAEVAHYSPFHFHRIFRIIANEPLNIYINRRRIEKAASILMHRPEVSISELSLQYGFSSNSSFSRVFKKFYGVSPSDFRKHIPDRFSKIGKRDSKNGQVDQLFEKYICNINNLKNWIDMNAKIEIKEMPGQELAYVSSIGHTVITEAYQRLMQWATPNNLFDNPSTKMVTVYHDSFKITDPDKIRMSACITLKEPIGVSGEVGLMSLEAGKFIVGNYEIGLSEFEKAWSGLFIWMNEQGYKKADRNPFEIYHNNFNDHPEKKCIVDFCIPIE
ncbi:MAG: GyrI-like domain-containing protein [Bacteroidota bacterium]